MDVDDSDSAMSEVEDGEESESQEESASDNESPADEEMPLPAAAVQENVKVKKVSGPSKQTKRKRTKKPKQQRRNIRKILELEKLNKETLAAQQEERERLLRREQQRAELHKALEDASGDSAAKKDATETIESDDSPTTTDTRGDDLGAGEGAPVAMVLNVENHKPNNRRYDVCILDSSDESGDEQKRNDDLLVDTSLEEDEEQPTVDVDGRVLVNVDHPSNEDDVYLTPLISRVIKPHQVNGIRFIYDNLIESLTRYEKDKGFGCILAHAMGLGKTIQTISFIDVFLRFTPAKKVLVIVPINTLHNWLAEFNKWLPDALDSHAKPDEQDDISSFRSFQIFFMGESQKTNASRADLIAQWDDQGGVLLMGYEMYRILALYTPTLCNSKAFEKGRRKKQKDKNVPAIVDIEEEEKEMEMVLSMQRSLCNPGPDLVVCDEGHRIKNFKSGISKALNKISTRKRLVLTGYPLQNNLIEYWCMVDFVRPNYLGTRAEFTNMFERPIVNGQCKDSTETDRQLMRYRVHVLFSLLQGFVQRKGHAILLTTLPPKEEMVILVRMSPVQKALYCKFVDVILGKANGEGTLNPIKLFALFCKIWNHPDILYNAMVAEKNGKKVNLFESDDGSNLSPPAAQGQENKALSTPVSTWANKVFQEHNFKPGDFSNSGKMTIFLRILGDTIALGEKLLVFSQSLLTLDSIEDALAKERSPTGTIGWIKNLDYYRLDGSTSGLERERLINLFNHPENIQAKLFLLSTRAGCLGINLTAASRVVVFDVSWNPCYDAQAICRVYRYGQTRPCFIYRLVASNTMETKMYYRQISKQGISDRVVDERNLSEDLTKRDVAVLMNLEWNHEPMKDYSEDIINYCDGLLISLCLEYSKWITQAPFKHESLLIKAAIQELSHQEKQEAQQSYEAQKRMGAGSNALSNVKGYRTDPLFDRDSEKNGVVRPVVSVRPMIQGVCTMPMGPTDESPFNSASGNGGAAAGWGGTARAGVHGSDDFSGNDMATGFVDACTNAYGSASTSRAVGANASTYGNRSAGTNAYATGSSCESGISTNPTTSTGNNPFAPIDPLNLLRMLSYSHESAFNLMSQSLLTGNRNQATIVLPRIGEQSNDALAADGTTASSSSLCNNPLASNNPLPTNTPLMAYRQFPSSAIATDTKVKFDPSKAAGLISGGPPLIMQAPVVVSNTKESAIMIDDDD